jgi:hypothetical protein
VDRACPMITLIGEAAASGVPFGSAVPQSPKWQNPHAFNLPFAFACQYGHGCWGAAREYCVSGAVIDYYKRLYAAQKAPGANKHTRLALIVAERGINETELQEFRGTRGNAFDYYAFAKRYRVSIDWLLDGDLRGLRETVTRGR